MNSLKIVSLKFNSFRSFVEAQDTGVLPDNGLFGIIGKNNGTTGSSGSGKTNFHLALSYALGYCPFPATELQSWLTKEPMQVELTMETPSGLVIIKRGSETSISIDGAKFEGARVVDTKLKQILVWPIPLIEALTFRQQKMPGRFLAMTDSEKKEFLCSLLGLQDIETQIEVAAKKTNEAEKNYSELTTIISTLTSHLDEPSRPAYQDDSFELLQIEKLKAQKAEIEFNLIKFKEDVEVFNIQISIAEIERFNGESHSELLSEIARLRALDEQYKELLRQTIKNCEINIKDLKRHTIDGIVAVQFSINTLNNEIKDYHAEICGRCNQIWPHGIEGAEWLASKEEELARRGIELNKVIEIEAAISRNLTISNRTKDSLANFNNEVVKNLEADLQLKRAESANKSLNFDLEKQAKIVLLKKLRQPSLDRYLEEKEYLGEIIEELRVAEGALKDIAKEQAWSLAIYDSKKEAFNNSLQEIMKAETRLASFKMIMDEETDFLTLLKNFLGTIFTEVLQEIANEANDTLKQLPNVATTTIQFDTEVISQKGKLRQEIKPVVIKNGVTIPIKSGLSGGQFTSIELATDLAIGKVIAQRTGLSLNWLVLDESFEGHDVPVKEACLELLKNAAKDKLIFVIDHATEVNEYFDKCITIESNNDTSTIKSIA